MHSSLLCFTRRAETFAQSAEVTAPQQNAGGGKSVRRLQGCTVCRKQLINVIQVQPETTNPHEHTSLCYWKGRSQRRHNQDWSDLSLVSYEVFHSVTGFCTVICFYVSTHRAKRKNSLNKTLTQRQHAARRSVYHQLTICDVEDRTSSLVWIKAFRVDARQQGNLKMWCKTRS